jgi:hypothetical protein
MNVSIDNLLLISTANLFKDNLNLKVMQGPQFCDGRWSFCENDLLRKLLLSHQLVIGYQSDFRLPSQVPVCLLEDKPE